MSVVWCGVIGWILNLGVSISCVCIWLYWEF